MILRGQEHGARVYRVGRRLFSKADVLRGSRLNMWIDEQHERHVPCDDDAQSTAAIRDAVGGRI